MADKNPTIDIAKGVAIILVVYGHVIQHSMAPGTREFFLNPVFKVIYTFHMPLFVFISGFLMASSLNRKSVGDVFVARVKSLLLPFMSLVFLGTIITYVLNRIFGYDIASVNITGSLVDQLFFKPSVWFLFTLFALSGILAYSVKLEKYFGGVIFAVIYFLLMIIPYNEYCALYYIKWFYPFYLAGYLFNKYNVKVPGVLISAGILPVSLGLFSWLVIYWHTNDYIYINKMNFMSYQYFSETLRLMYRYIMGFLGIILVFYLSGYLVRSKAGALLGKIGAYSLDIYIIQMFILEGIYPRLIYKVQVHLDLGSPLTLYVAAPLIAMFFVGVCILSSKLLIRKYRLLNALLLGGRG